MPTIAIGDIHGMKIQLLDLLTSIKYPHPDLFHSKDLALNGARFIFLGDYIDRGPDSADVVSIVRSLQQRGAICLRGNHEQLAIDSVRSEYDLLNFIYNGGDATLKSFGSLEKFEEARRWMETLPTFFEDELRYYVHAGVDPALPLAEQTNHDRLWIRNPFLEHKGPFEKYIVHGHTPTNRLKPPLDMPDVRPNRCNVDTGAVYGGNLSAAIFDDTQAEPLYTSSMPLCPPHQL